MCPTAEGQVEVAVAMHAETAGPPGAPWESGGFLEGLKGCRVQLLHMRITVHTNFVAQGIHVHQVHLARFAQHDHISGGEPSRGVDAQRFVCLDIQALQTRHRLQALRTAILSWPGAGEVACGICVVCRVAQIQMC